MQSKGRVVIFLAILAFPVIAISANHNIFFSVIAAVITFVSLMNIFYITKRIGFGEQQIDEELEEELEELIEIDVRKFGAGLNVVYNLIAILFLCYCAFFLETISLKSIAAFAILLQIHFILKKVKKNSDIFDKNKHKPQILLASISNIAVVLFTLLNKISKIS